MSDEKLFGDMLTALRLERQKAARGDRDEEEAKRWTSQGVADALEVSRQTYSGWENGHHLLKPNELRAIAKLFRLSVEERDALYRAAAQGPPIQEPSKIDNLPFQRNPFFTGREEHLERLRKELQETGAATITQPSNKSINISGLGGIGKTELALEYTHLYYRDVYRVALWVNAADEDTLRASYIELAEVLKLPERNEQKLDRRVRAVKDWLKTHTSWLLIMDNADDLPLAESFLPAKPLGHVVFTTRSQSIGTTTTRSNHIEVEKMESDDGLLFMLLRSDKLEDRTKLNEVATDILETAREVVELLGGYPLALDQAGAYIQVTGVSFTDYKKRFHKERRRLLKRRSLLKSNDSKHSRHPLPTAATLDLCINEACKGQPLASDILHFCALLQPDVIPRKLFEDDDSFKYGTTEFDEAIAALLSYSLVKRNAPHQEFQKSSNARQTFSIHRMVHAVLIDNMSPELQKQWREHVVLTLKAAFGEEYYMLGDPSNLYIDNLLSHVLAIADWTEDELTPSMEVADLHQKAGRYFHVIGKYSVAKKLLVRANSIYEQLFGAEHFVAVTALNDLACVYYAERNYVQAEPLFQQVRAMLERLLEAEHRNTVFMIINLAHLYIHQGKYEQAESLLLQTLSICENQLGDKHPDIPSCMAILVLLYFAQGKYEQAESYQERVISLEVKAYQGVLGPDTTFISQYNLALLYEKQGKYEQADLFYSREGRMFMRKLEYEYPDSHISIQGFAMFLHAQGMREQALAMRLKALHIREREQMATHLEVLRARKAYARFLNCMARYDEAQALLEIEDW